MALKTAIIKPLLKKKNLDASILNNYRPISNLPFIGKVIEKVVYQITTHLNQNDIFDIYQSGFHQHHITETALVKIVNDIRLNTDAGKITILQYLTSVQPLILLTTKYYCTDLKTGSGFQVQSSNG